MEAMDGPDLRGCAGIGGAVLPGVSAGADGKRGNARATGGSAAGKRRTGNYRPRLAQLDREVAELKAKLEIENRIVPGEKEAEGLIRVLDAEALKSGIEIRRYTARPVVAKQFYTEVPFELELDGPYYPMLDFFDRVGRMERIVNISELMVATTKKPADAKAKRQYQYGPHETVVATCTATTFFSHAAQGPGSATGTKK